jgi:hypothetical protein
VEIWVLLIIAIKSKLGEAVKNMEKKIMRVALNHSMPAEKQSRIVSDLINKKNMLINLKVLSDRIEESLEKSKLDIIKEFLSAREEAYSIENKRTRGEFIELVLSLADEGAQPLRAIKLTVGKMEEDYLSLPLVYMTLMMIRRKLSGINVKRVGVKLAFKNCQSFTHAV